MQPEWSLLGPLMWSRYVSKQVTVTVGSKELRGWLQTVDPVSARWSATLFVCLILMIKKKLPPDFGGRVARSEGEHENETLFTTLLFTTLLQLLRLTIKAMLPKIYDLLYSYLTKSRSPYVVLPEAVMLAVVFTHVQRITKEYDWCICNIHIKHLFKGILLISGIIFLII